MVHGYLQVYVNLAGQVYVYVDPAIPDIRIPCRSTGIRISAGTVLGTFDSRMHSSKPEHHAQVWFDALDDADRLLFQQYQRDLVSTEMSMEARIDHMSLCSVKIYCHKTLPMTLPHPSGLYSQPSALAMIGRASPFSATRLAR